LAKFEHAINKTMPTMASKTALPNRIAPRPVLELSLPKMTSVIGRTAAVRP
jgi:hypothetical protein